MNDYTTDNRGFYRLNRRRVKLRPLAFHNGEVYIDSPVFVAIRRQWREVNRPGVIRDRA